MSYMDIEDLQRAYGIEDNSDDAVFYTTVGESAYHNLSYLGDDERVGRVVEAVYKYLDAMEVASLNGGPKMPKDVRAFLNNLGTTLAENDKYKLENN